MVMAKTKIASLGELLATRARATFRYRVNFDTVALHNLDVMREWCNENCKDIWRCESYHALYFQFANNYDATMFMLRWGGANGNTLK